MGARRVQRLIEETYPELKAATQGRGPLWIVDPIDGTVTYAYGHPQVAVSIAFALDGLVQVGVVHAPFQGETFAAARGAGARLNGGPAGRVLRDPEPVGHRRRAADGDRSRGAGG